MLVQRGPGRHGPGGEGGQHHLRGGWAKAERGVWAYCVVVPPPALDHDLGLAQRVEDLAVEQLVAQPRVEALNVAVLPRAELAKVLLAQPVEGQRRVPGAMVAV